MSHHLTDFVTLTQSNGVYYKAKFCSPFNVSVGNSVYFTIFSDAGVEF